MVSLNLQLLNSTKVQRTYLLNSLTNFRASVFQTTQKDASFGICRTDREWWRHTRPSQVVTEAASRTEIVSRRKSVRPLSRRLRLPPKATPQRTGVALGRRNIASLRRRRASLPHRPDGRHALQPLAWPEVSVSGRSRVTQTKRQSPGLFVAIFGADCQSWVCIWKKSHSPKDHPLHAGTRTK